MVNPCSSDDAGTGALGGAVAFGKTADGLYNDILGKPATATADRVPGAYDAAQRRSHTIIPVVEVFGGIHADGLCSKHGARLGADELSAP